MKHAKPSGASRVGIITDLTDVVLIAALALLPAGGTVFGFSMMYWSPISPILFVLYTLLSVRHLPRVFERFRALLLFPIALIVVSIYGWLTIGIHAHTAFQTLVAIISGVACLISLDIAFRIKRLDPHTAVTIVAAAYWVSFGVGVVQFLAIHLHIQPIIQLCRMTIERNYVPNHIQFLFAEPSYIGMHVFGVLMPLCWLTKRKGIAVLTLVYAFGAAAMGAGVRILIDSVIALVLWLIVIVNFRKIRNIAIALVGVAIVGAGGGFVMMHNARVQSLLANGPVAGDFSATARLFRTLAPVEAWLSDPWHMLFGFGIGNLKDAIARGYDAACQALIAMGGDPQGNGEIRLLGTPPGDHYIFTMNAYVDFITEFGLGMFLAAVVLIIVHITRNRAWNKMTICWLILLAYLYIQFEGYAFYAFWLFLWIVGVDTFQGSGTSVRRNQQESDVKSPTR